MISDLLLHSTVRITSIFKNNMIGTGTGFFFIFTINNNEVPVIVTNKHVVKNSIKGNFRLSLADSNGNWIKNSYIDINCDDFEKMWIMHPEEKIDIAAFPGSSGSPIFIYNQGSYPVQNGIVVGSRLILLGVLYAGTKMNIEGNVEIVEVPTVNIPIMKSKIPNNIGIIIKIEKLLDFEIILEQKLNNLERS